MPVLLAVADEITCKTGKNRWHRVGNRVWVMVPIVGIDLLFAKIGRTPFAPRGYQSLT